MHTLQPARDFCIDNVKITCVIIEYLKSYKNILKKPILTVYLKLLCKIFYEIYKHKDFCKKKEGRKEVDEGIHRSEVLDALHWTVLVKTPAAEPEKDGT